MATKPTFPRARKGETYADQVCRYRAAIAVWRDIQAMAIRAPANVKHKHMVRAFVGVTLGDLADADIEL